MGYRERVVGVTRHAIARLPLPPSPAIVGVHRRESWFTAPPSLPPPSPLRYSCLVSPSIKAPFVSLDFSHLQQCFPSLLLLHLLLSPGSPTRCRSSLPLHAALRYYHLRRPGAPSRLLFCQAKQFLICRGKRSESVGREQSSTTACLVPTTFPTRVQMHDFSNLNW